jgi:hypothetical protein
MERSHRIWKLANVPANRILVCDWDIVPDELSAAGLIVPEPSVTPSPFAVWAWAEYIAADGAMQRREARQVFRPQCSNVSFCFSAFAPRSAGCES